MWHSTRPRARRKCSQLAQRRRPGESTGGEGTSPTKACHFRVGMYSDHMVTMSISLPDDMTAFIDDQVSDEGYASRSEYILRLVRYEQRKARLRRLLQEAADSPLGPEADDAYFEELDRRSDERARAR